MCRCTHDVGRSALASLFLLVAASFAPAAAEVPPCRASFARTFYYVPLWARKEQKGFSG